MHKPEEVLTNTNLINGIRENMHGHPLYDLIDKIHEYYDLQRDDKEILDSPDAWTFFIYNLATTMIINSSHDSAYTEAWLCLGELRSYIRLTVNADPDTEEEDEIFFRANPDQIDPAFAQFLGIIRQYMLESFRQQTDDKVCLN